MSRHVMECLGLSRVVIEDGKVVEVSAPRIKYCPLFAARRGIGELTEEAIKENIEYRIKHFGMCCDNRETVMQNFLNFGVSETLSSALINKRIDCAVIAADGCGTAVITDPALVQGLGGRISGICETEPIPKVVEAVGPENMVDAETAKIDMEAGAKLAFSKGYQKVALTTPSAQVACRLREKYGDRIILVAVHTSGMSPEDAELAFDNFDIITACASKNLRDVAKTREGILIAGRKVPVYGVTTIGKELIQTKLDEACKEPTPADAPQEPPYPLI